MGWRDRTWAPRTEEEIEAQEGFTPEGDEHPLIPLWETTADLLRVKLHAFVKGCPITSLQELAMLIDCANHAQMFHIRGKQLDKEDEQEDEDE
jgi:hypothetical protein